MLRLGVLWEISRYVKTDFGEYNYAAKKKVAKKVAKKTSKKVAKKAAKKKQLKKLQKK